MSSALEFMQKLAGGPGPWAGRAGLNVSKLRRMPTVKVKRIGDRLYDVAVKKMSLIQSTTSPDIRDRATNTAMRAGLALTDVLPILKKNFDKKLEHGARTNLRLVKKATATLSALEFMAKLATGNHGGPGSKTPRFIKHEAKAIAKKKGISEDRGYAIAVGNAQNQGALRRGSMDKTSRGKTLERRHRDD